MKADLKEKWVKALRSGRYKQREGQLGTTHGPNCCLGVLCRVARLPAHRWEGHSDLTSIGALSQMGLKPDQEQTLMSLNDDDSAPFSEIADYIEANL